MKPNIQNGNCTEILIPKIFESIFGKIRIDLNFLDPPFNQDKDYNEWDDNLSAEEYWNWMKEVCGKILSYFRRWGNLLYAKREKYRACPQVFA